MTLIKSISGIRGIINTSLNSNIIKKYVHAFSNTSIDGKILLGRDTRNSGDEYINIAKYLLNHINRESIDCGIIPTPTAQFLVKKNNYVGGIVFTASHNPSNWNGMKFIDSDGIFIDQEKLNQLELEFKNLKSEEIKSFSESNKNPSLEYIDSHLTDILNLSVVTSKLIKEKTI